MSPEQMVAPLMLLLDTGVTWSHPDAVFHEVAARTDGWSADDKARVQLACEQFAALLYGRDVAS